MIGSALAFYDWQLAFQAAAVMGLAIGTFAVTGLVLACTLMVSETRLAVDQLAEEAELARARYGSSGGDHA